MPISVHPDRTIVLLGGGREGLATFAWLRAQGHQGMIGLLGDEVPPQLPEDLPWIAAGALDDWLAQAPLVIRSPGFAPHHALRQRIDATGVEQTTATRITLAALAAAGIPVIGITASKGKSTISTLTRLMLEATGIPARLVGNIGVPALSQLDDILAAPAPVVMELSSYQCADLAGGEGPAQVILGSLFPEHLDWHGSLQAYYAAKAALVAAAPAGAQVHIDARSHATLAAHGLDQVLARSDVTVEWVNHARGLHVDDRSFWDGGQALLPAAAMRLPGRHNRENACLAFSAARRLGAGVEQLAQVLSQFGGLPFRLEDEGLHGGIRWINDSISTAPEAASAGLEAMQGEVGTLIAGGQDRGYDYVPLARAMLQHGVRHLVALPESGPAIAAALQRVDAAGAVTVSVTGNLTDAVAVAARVTPAGRVCLFSPAAPSYHAWPDFEARGRDLRALLAALD